MSNGRYKAYPKYRGSGTDWMGEVPSDWTVIPLGRLFRRVKRVGHAKKELLSVYRDHGVVPTSSRDDNHNNPSEDLSPYQLVKVDDLVLNKMKAWQGSIAVSELEGIVSPAYFVYSPSPRLFELAHPRYIHYLLRNPVYISQYLRRSKGIRVGQWDLDPEEFQLVELLLPTKPEQIQIAKFLDHETAKIDRLIEKQEALIRLLKEKRQAVISHAVTKGLNRHAPLKDSGILWLGQIPAHWVVASLKFYAQVIDCKHITAEFLDDGFPLASIGEVKGWFVNLDTAKRTTKKFYTALIEGGRKPEPGNIIFTRNATVGEAAIVPQTHPEFAMGQDVCLIRVTDVLSPEYTLHVLKSGLISKQLDLAMIGSTFKRINVDDIRNFIFAIPPIGEQAGLASEMNRISKKYDRLISEAENSAALLQERRTALISAAVTGKIDVRHWQPAGSDNN